jgi:hypothetical protein
MNLKAIAEKVFPFLFSEVTKEWDSLTPEEQQALIKSGQIGQIIKETISQGTNAVINAISQKLGLSTDQVNTTLVALFTTMGLNLGAAESAIEQKVDNGINQLQTKINSGLQDSEWNSLWEAVTGAAVAIVSHNPVNWITLLTTVGKFVYDKFIRKPH